MTQKLICACSVGQTDWQNNIAETGKHSDLCYKVSFIFTNLLKKKNLTAVIFVLQTILGIRYMSRRKFANSSSFSTFSLLHLLKPSILFCKFLVPSAPFRHLFLQMFLASAHWQLPTWFVSDYVIGKKVVRF